MNTISPSKMLSRAIAYAAKKHVDVMDRGGVPYILHTLKVSHYLRTTDYELMAIAVLHDVIEDTDATYAELREMGMSERVIEGVRCMTKLPGQTPEEYQDQVASNKDSILVKLADLRHNSDIRRLKGVTEKDIKRVEKYNKLYEYLKTLA